MKYMLLKITCELYAPGAILSPTTVKRLATCGNFHSRRLIYPEDALFTYTTPGLNNFRIVTTDFFHFRFSSMDDEYQSVFDSGADYLWSNMKLEDFFGTELDRMAQTAMIKAPPYQENRTYAGWMELWHYGETARMGQKLREITLNDIMEKTKTP